MNVNTENEHILVCLSSSPQIRILSLPASKMANALQAQFTALYVQTGARIQSEDKERLDENIRFAEELGAEIVMTHGENVPLQISEYAQLSNVTEIVIGQSSMKRNYFFSRKTLTEKLIDIVPDIDIHIIPDTVKAENYREGHLSLHVEKPSVKECFLTVLIFVICTFIGLVFQKFHFSRSQRCDHLYSWGIAYLNFDRWISMQCCGFCHECLSFLLFSHRPRCHFRPMQWVSGDICDLLILCADGHWLQN